MPPSLAPSGLAGSAPVATAASPAPWPPGGLDAAHRARPLLTLSAVQRHAAPLLARIQAGESPHFSWDGAAFDALLQRAADVLRRADAAPPRQPPWPRYACGEVDRWGELAWAEGLAPGALADHHCEERARTRIDLLLVTALLACDAAPGWRYRDRASGQELAGSDALAVAALRFFASGACSAQPHHPLRADADALAAITAETLAAAFPPHEGRPLPALERRAERLRRLGRVAQAHPALFAAPEGEGRLRLGHLLDACLERAHGGVPAGAQTSVHTAMQAGMHAAMQAGMHTGRHAAAQAGMPAGALAADDLLALLLVPLNDLAPGRLSLSGQPLGDCWAHPHAPGGLVPLHGLAQGLALGLVEPLRDAGLTLHGLGAAPAAAGWRLGGWLLDAGVLCPRQPHLLAQRPRLDALPVVEWRAATGAAIEQMAHALLAQHDTPPRASAPGALHGLLRRLAREDAAHRRPDAAPAWLPDAAGLLG